MRIVSRTPATLLAALSIGLMLGGCGMLRSSRLAQEGAAQPLPAPVVQAAQPAQSMQPVPAADAGNGGIETIPFRVGVSSATVEKLGRQRGCTGGPGAGLITEEGPVEVYRMQCDGGKTFMARCELHQCKPM